MSLAVHPATFELSDRDLSVIARIVYQQCGINLKVRENKVIGFEPREEFPFNRGKLCPKGIKRYMQNEHPDRLLHPLKRTEAGFKPISWDEALSHTVSEIKRIQQQYGKDSFAMLSGVSLSN